MSGNACVAGLDFDADSVRSIVADATTGSVLGR
jgi:ribulose kinase